MYYRIVIVFFLLALGACGEADKVPKGVLTKEQMRDVLLDMTMADAYSNNNEDPRTPLPDSVRRQRVKLYYRQILDLHHLTEPEFQKSYSFYESHPDRLKEVYDMMMDVATANREALDQEARLKAYMENPFANLPFGNSILSANKVMFDVPFIKPKPVEPHRPNPLRPTPAPPKKPVNGQLKPIHQPLGGPAGHNVFPRDPKKDNNLKKNSQ